MGSEVNLKGLCFNGKIIKPSDGVLNKNIISGDVLHMSDAGGAAIEARHWYRGRGMTHVDSHDPSWSL